MVQLRGELRCMACSRYLGDFESAGPDGSGLRIVQPEFGALAAHAVETERGLQCSHCGGRVFTEYVDRIAA